MMEVYKNTLQERQFSQRMQKIGNPLSQGFLKHVKNNYSSHVYTIINVCTRCSNEKNVKIITKRCDLFG